jgi:DNA-binding MarR family transcriptional regulator
MPASPESSRDVSRALDAVRKIVRALRLSSRAVEKEVGITGAQLFVLQQLAAKPAESVNELAERTLTHQSTVSVVVARLVQRGLVTRSSSREDARRTEIAVSPGGLALLDQSPPTVQARLATALRSLSDEQLRGLADGLDAWLYEAGMHGEVPGLFFEEESSHD